MEKIIVNPLNVRGLGNVVESKEASDFLGYNSKTTSSTDSTYGTVYSSSYLSGSYIVLECPSLISPDDSSFTVKATLKNNSDSVISSATVYCSVNGTVTSGSTDSSGVKSFTVTCDGSDVYDIRVYYTGTNSVAGSSRTQKVVCTELTGLELMATKNVIQEDSSTG